MPPNPKRAKDVIPKGGVFKIGEKREKLRNVK